MRRGDARPRPRFGAGNPDLAPRTLARRRRLVINATNTLSDFHLYDRIVALSEGVVVYNGPREYFAYYFGLENLDAIFAHLKTRSSEDWKASWNKRGPYFDVSNETAGT